MSDLNLRAKEKTQFAAVLAEYKHKKKLVNDRKQNEQAVTDQNLKLANALGEIMSGIAQKYGALLDVNIKSDDIDVRVHIGMRKFFTTAAISLPSLTKITLNEKNLKKAMIDLEVRIRWIRRFMLKDSDMLKSHGNISSARVFFTTRDRYFV